VMRSGGKSIRRGRGGVTRSRYHSAGSAMRAARAAGAAKPVRAQGWTLTLHRTDRPASEAAFRLVTLVAAARGAG
jgi:hypothetical protein